MSVYDGLVEDAYLMVGVDERKTLQRLRLADVAREIEVYRVENLIVGNASRYHIVACRLLSSTTLRHEIEPLLIVRGEVFDTKASQIVV